MSHTPGPWLLIDRTVYALTQDGWHKGKPQMVNRFSVHVQRGHESTPEELNATARLIAAAPDLLSALQRAQGCIQGLLSRTAVRDVSETLSEIGHAIDKARGE